MLEVAGKHHGIPLDAVISVAAAGSFRLYVATHWKAAQLLDLPMDDLILFIVNHAFDCFGAKSAGMKAAFINRRDRPFAITPHRPDITVRR